MISDQQWQMERSAFLDSHPPRHVPASVAKAAAPQGGRVIMFIGLIFLVMGLVFSWIFLPVYLPRQWKLDREPAAAVQGTITGVQDTNMKINRTRVKQYTYRFATKDGAGKEGIAYTTGARWKEGRKVKVRYLVSDPSVSVPLGARMGEADTTSSFVILFPVVGMTLFLAPLIGHRRRTWLLRNGSIGKGTVTALEKTSVSVNNQPQYKIRITRADDSVESVMRSHDQGVIAFATMKMESAEPVTILYDRRTSKRMMLPEAWGA